ncbi:MAG: hypothetical protein QM581_00120 [Pseudomonas sp.]
MLPLILLTFCGVMIFAAQQTLALAAAEGARAAMRYGEIDERRQAACEAASESMQWLIEFSGDEADCSSADAAPVTVESLTCTADTERQCMQVTVSYDYASHPFLPGTVTLYDWTLDELSSTAVAQLDLDD